MIDELSLINKKITFIWYCWWWVIIFKLFKI